MQLQPTRSIPMMNQVSRLMMLREALQPMVRPRPWARAGYFNYFGRLRSQNRPTSRPKNERSSRGKAQRKQSSHVHHTSRVFAADGSRGLVDVKLESSHEMRETRAEQIAPWADEFNSPSLCALMPKAPKKKILLPYGHKQSEQHRSRRREWKRETLASRLRDRET